VGKDVQPAHDKRRPWVTLIQIHRSTKKKRAAKNTESTEKSWRKVRGDSKTSRKQEFSKQPGQHGINMVENQN